MIDDGCVTVSGHPDDLAAFKSFLPAGTRICETNIVALYHVPSKLNGVREALLKDVASRRICFPTFQDLFVPVRSSFDGGIVNGSLCDQPLIQSIVDMVLVQPVNWEAVVNCTVASIPSCSEVELLNVDISKTLLKGFENSLPHHCISDFRYFDLKNEDGFPTARAQVPIAIVGMAVKMPGAESVDELWNTLTKGLNTLETVGIFLFLNGSPHSWYNRFLPIASTIAMVRNLVEEWLSALATLSRALGNLTTSTSKCCPMPFLSTHITCYVSGFSVLVLVKQRAWTRNKECYSTSLMRRSKMRDTFPIPLLRF